MASWDGRAPDWSTLAVDGPTEAPGARGRTWFEWQFAERPVSEGGSAVQVALHGRDAMSDHRLRAEIFDRAPVVLPPRSARRNPRAVHHSRNPRLSSLMTGEAYMDGDPAAAGGLAVGGSAGTLDGGAGLEGRGDGGGG